MVVPRLGVISELQLPATATAKRDLSCICDLHHSSRHCQILNPVSEARDRTRNLMVPSRICFCCTTTGNASCPDLESAISPPEPQKRSGKGTITIRKWKGVPVVVQQKQIRLGTMRLWVRSLASLSGLRIWRCHELWCRSQTHLRSDVAVAVAVV